MALFKPEVKQVRSFKGICEFAIVGFEDMSDSVEWADYLINVIVKLNGSDYTNKISLKGKVDTDANGKVTGGDFFNRLYSMFEVLGCNAGINVDNKWEDENGELIDDIAEYLTARFSEDPNKVTQFPFVSYFYKSVPKMPGGQSYNQSIGVIELNNTKGIAKIQSNVDWRKSKGYLKEWDGSSSAPEPADLGIAALGNL